MWLLGGWPYKMQRVLGDEKTARATEKRFIDDWAAYQALSGHENKTNAMESLMDRSCFKWPNVLQYVEVPH